MEPARSGNGLARRAAHFVTAASNAFDTTVCVIPISGYEDYRPAAPSIVPTIHVRLGPRGHEGSDSMASASWRRRLSSALPFPPAANFAPPTLASEVSARLRDAGVPSGAAVHVMRASLAPLGVALSEVLRAPWRTLDLDDDDASLAASTGDGTLASQYERLVRTFAPLFDRCCTAAPLEAAALNFRLGIQISVVRNSVSLVGDVARVPEEPPLLLYVGNLTYPPNIHAASVLAREVLPLVQAALRRPVNLSVVGPYVPSGPVAGLARLPGVRLHGYEPDLAPVYSRASLVVAPLLYGAGTSIKLLEAFAHGVPVVTTRTGARGFPLRDGEHLLLGERPQEIAGAVERVLRDPGLGSSLAASARQFVEAQHSASAGEAEVREFLLGAAHSAMTPGTR